MSEIFKTDPRSIKIPERVIAARLGFKGVGKIPENFLDSFNRAYEIAMEVAIPTALYDTFEAKETPEGLIVCGKLLKGKMVTQHLRNSSSVTLILSTIGMKYDEKIEELHRSGEELLSFFLDGIGSELVEYFTRELDKVLRERMGSGSARISPGYGDLPLELNAWIIDTLGGEEIGVSYDPETFIMKPRKTITALIGWKKILIF